MLKKRCWKRTLLFAIFAMVVPSLGHANLITFDDLPGDFGVVPNGYAGLNWSFVDYANASLAGGGPSGYPNGMLSSPNVAFGGFGFTDSFSAIGGTFIFDSIYLTAAWNDGLNINIQGLLGGTVIDSQSIIANTSGPTFFAPNWTGIDTVTFTSSGGTPHFSRGGTQFAMDNLSVAPVPEPGSLLLLGTGLLGLGGSLKRKFFS